MLAWYGGIDADLRDATLADGATLTVTALFGGVSIRVPAEWRMETTVRVARRRHGRFRPRTG